MVASPCFWDLLNRGAVSPEGELSELIQKVGDEEMDFVERLSRNGQIGDGEIGNSGNKDEATVATSRKGGNLQLESSRYEAGGDDSNSETATSADAIGESRRIIAGRKNVYSKQKNNRNTAKRER